MATTEGATRRTTINAPEPMCFVSDLNKTAYEQVVGNSSHNDPIFFNDDGDDPVIKDLRILPGCFSGTDITGTFDYEEPNPAVQRLPYMSDDDGSGTNSSGVYSVYTGNQYNFSVTITLNMTSLLERIDDAADDDDDDYPVVRPQPTEGGGNNITANTIRAKTRFQICNALHVGTCSPILRALLSDDNATFAVRSEHPTNIGGGAATVPQSGRWTVDGFGDAASAGATDNGNAAFDDIAVQNDGAAALIADNSYVSTIHYADLMLTALSDPRNEIYQATSNLTLSVPATAQFGAYFVVGDVILDFATVAADVVKRVDISISLPDNALFVSEPPLFQTVTEGMVVYVSVLIAIVGTFVLLCLLYIIRHRQHPIMQLSQAPFIATLTGCALVQTIFSFAYLPIRDLFCNMIGPLVLIPLHLAAAIMVGRLWRVQKTLATANFIGRRATMTAQTQREQEAWYRNWRPCQCDPSVLVIEALTWIANLPFSWPFFSKKNRSARGRKSPRESIRQTATAKECLSLIILLTLPQFVLQVFGSIYFDRDLEPQFDLDTRMGRIVCASYGKWVESVGIGLASLMYVVAVVVAWISRQLPSALNETSQVFRAAGLASILALITIPLAILTDVPSNSPDTVVFFRSLLSIGIAFINVTSIIVPKLRRVWTGK